MNAADIKRQYPTKEAQCSWIHDSVTWLDVLVAIVLAAVLPMAWGSAYGVLWLLWTMQTCKTCRWWQSDESWCINTALIDHGPGDYRPAPNGFGIPEACNGYGERIEPKLLTGPDFGCVLHQPHEPQD